MEIHRGQAPLVVPFPHTGAAPDEGKIGRRRALYFEPYHAAIMAELTRLRAAHRHVVPYNAHAIRSTIPRLFAGELPQFNIGTHGRASCAREKGLDLPGITGKLPNEP